MVNELKINIYGKKKIEHRRLSQKLLRFIFYFLF